MEFRGFLVIENREFLIKRLQQGLFLYYQSISVCPLSVVVNLWHNDKPVPEDAGEKEIPPQSQSCVKFTNECTKYQCTTWDTTVKAVTEAAPDTVARCGWGAAKSIQYANEKGTEVVWRLS